MQHDYFQKNVMDLLIPPQGQGVLSMGKIFATILLRASFPLLLYATWPYSENVELSPPHPIRPARG